ncbi:hypothetical protein [Actinophytocola sp.]|uniref:hypothetical protein n=1 Tax=Actinophytocola sp. TaxID=1872138 RepID=UPI00389A34B9
MRAWPRRAIGGAAAGGLLVGGCALTVLVVGLLTRMAPVILVSAVAVSAAAGGAIAFLAAGNRRRDTRLWQEAAVAVAVWAGHNDGRSGTDPAAFGGNWTLPASPRFTGAILAVGRRDGFEVGVSCSAEPHGEGATSRHTTMFVRLRHAHAPVQARWRFRRRVAAPVAGTPADLAVGVALVAVEERELRILYTGWPVALDLDACVDGAVEVARALDRDGR